MATARSNNRVPPPASPYEIPAEFHSLFTPAQAEELAAQFRQSDTDGSGSIDEREFRALLIRMGMELSAVEVDTLVSTIDADGDGLLDFRELVQMVVRLQKGDAKLTALRQFMESLDTTPVYLLEREAAKFGLQVTYQLLEDEQDEAQEASDESQTSYLMQLVLLGKACGPTGRETLQASGKTTREAKFRAAEAALVRIKKLQPGMAVEPGQLPSEWQQWLFDNIERGASVKKLLQALGQKGFQVRAQRGSPRGDALHEKNVIQQRTDRVRVKEVRLEAERVAQRRQEWQTELDRMTEDFNTLDTLNHTRMVVKENDGKPVAHVNGWDIYEEPLSYNRVFENPRSGFLQRQVPTQVVGEGQTRLGWKEKLEISAHFVEKHRLKPEWELHRMNGADVYFFFNRETEECQWISPEGLSIREWRTKRFFQNAEQIEDEPDQDSLIVKFSGSSSPAIVDNATKGRTLGKWRECKGFGGVTFYFQSSTKQILVEKPEEVLRHESYRYAQTLILARSEEIESHDRGWRRYYDPQTSHTFYFDELSGDCVHDTFATPGFLQQIRRPKRQARFAFTSEELRRRREEQEWKSALQRSRRHEEHLKNTKEESEVTTEQQKRDKDELENAMYKGGAHELLALEQTRLAHEQDDCELPEVHVYKVPRDTKLLKLQAWGAGGGSGLLRSQTVGHGGGGAFVEVICQVFPGETLYFSVGSGGSSGAFARMVECPDDKEDEAKTSKTVKKVPGGIRIDIQVSTAAGGHPGGGQGHSGNKESACGGGGGFTSVYRQGAFGIEHILIAAGGGGGGTCRDGGGGGLCKAQKPREGDEPRCGRPGSDVAGGCAGKCDEFNPICKFVGTNGISLQGGDGAEFGGGGGGGLFGGGGGGFSPGIAGGGGGGSSYVNASLVDPKSVRVEAGKAMKPGGMEENPPQSVRSAYWDLVDGFAGEGGTGSTRMPARGNHGGVRLAKPGFFNDMKFQR
ncbi:hypothetical protein BBO99_00003726 [Phytophthora kernoviae]|uniref:receptor protein-tyrosine kinase n=1 Tax=Phytophthora kernoviae TaxID=325452 RepID=A0A421ET09_9STRA|nr:hypothetical protein BBI17_003789 [Phytophthora kernoviae]RLN81406.1 hypothetical protein BBO99_00003726 [Phytophthora kernoviae]